MPDAFFFRRLIALLWLGWGLYWLVAAASTKRTVRRQSALARLAYIIPLWIGGLLIAGRGIPWAPLAAPLWPRSLAAGWIGLILVAAGLGFAVWARIHLGRNWSGTVTVKEGHELIRSGPYAHVRHPIYTGLIAALLGTAITVGTAGAALGVAIITASFVRKLRTEEDFMRETFPAEYARYRAEVPGLLPFTRPRRSAPR